MNKYKQGVNPILPLNEYIPDGEPHVFGDRIYLFGSHDKENGDRYCELENYVGWSAPLSSPTEWEYHGEIYSSKQDPDYDEKYTNDLYAPDVVKGNDGRYYLYYNFTTSRPDYSGHDAVHVAVCDAPVGKYEYYGFVKNSDGTVHNTYLMGDPAVLNDDGKIRLYAGWSLSMVAAGAHAQGKGFALEEKKMQKDAPQMSLPEAGDPEMNQKLAPLYQMLFKRSPEKTKDLEYSLMGANAFTLADDMLTVIDGPKRILPGQFDTAKDSSFFGHAFYEASSIRKINGKYYFIYSSENSNELCYAISDFWDGPYVYGGTIISNGDVGYEGRKAKDRLNQTANDHGSLECINGQWYIFHHRQTHRSTFSRQACAEKVEISKDGSITQVECTSMGLNDGPLKANGEYPAVISCVLTNGYMPHITNTKLEDDIPYITNIGEERFITGVKTRTRIGYKYFDFKGDTKLSLKLRGEGGGKIVARTDERDLCEIVLLDAKEWTSFEGEFTEEDVAALYLDYEGDGCYDFISFELKS